MQLLLKTGAIVVWTATLSACLSAAPTVPAVTLTPYQFEANDGTVIAAERGVFKVPENRNDPRSREIELQFVRFASTSDAPGAPIVYLAGGPGGSGVATAKGRRFPLFMAMREFGDVIAFDQRGTGWSNHIPECVADERFPLNVPLTPNAVIPTLLAAASDCAENWREQGIDLAGYNTQENARDVDALRRVLGAEKISLWGISYGSHLAFAAMKTMQDRIDRVVLAGIEGLDATVKLPSRTDAYFARLQDAINVDPGAAEAFPDLAAMMHEVHAQLENEPITATFQERNGQAISMVFGKMEMQLLASFMIADPASAARLPAAYAMALAGNVDRIAPLAYQQLRKKPVSFRGMPEAMDIMSGISKERLGLVRDQSRTALLGEHLNFPMPHLAGAFGLDDLGDLFRAPVTARVPTLLLSGSLDGRTYPEAAKEAIRGSVTHVIVENGGHNIFMQSPVVSDLILQFMRGEKVPENVALDPPQFLH